MSERKTPTSDTPSTAKPRTGCLKLVASDGKKIEDEAPIVPPLPRRRSNLARFMDAYADAIDRDVQAILEL